MFTKVFFKVSPRWIGPLFKLAINTYAPFRGMRAKVIKVRSDFKKIEVQLNLTSRNRNIVGTAFGGSLYAMTDPFYMAMIMRHLGPSYYVWDYSATIKFKAPGKTKVRAVMELTQKDCLWIEQQLRENIKVYFKKKVLVKDITNNVVCEVEKVIYIRSKK